MTTPQKDAENIIQSMGDRLVPVLGSLLIDVKGAIESRILEERLRCIAVIRQYLLHDSQRAVSWHEVQDCIDAIRIGKSENKVENSKKPNKVVVAREEKLPPSIM
jgi:hypothetical protein